MKKKDRKFLRKRNKKILTEMISAVLAVSAIVPMNIPVVGDAVSDLLLDVAETTPYDIDRRFTPVEKGVSDGWVYAIVNGATKQRFSEDTSKQYAVIDRYIGEEKILEVPSEINGYKVKCCASNLSYSAEKIVYPKTVNYIYQSSGYIDRDEDGYIIEHDYFLKEVEFEEGCEVLFDQSCFSGMFTGIFVGESIKLPVMLNCYEYLKQDELVYNTDIVKLLGKNETYIMNCASADVFENCKNLKTVEFTNTGDFNIPLGFFIFCENLTNVIVPESMNICEINTQAFYETALADTSFLHNSNGTIVIKDMAFGSVKNLDKIDIDGDCIFEEDSIGEISSVTVNGNMEAQEGAFALKNLTVNGNAVFAENAFDEEYLVIENINISGDATIPDHLCSKPGSRFSPEITACTNLKSLYIGGNATIGADAFRQCLSLESVHIGGDCTIGDNAFASCNLSKELYFGGSAQIGSFCFANTQVKKITLNSDNIKNSSPDSFNDCFNLSDIEIGDISALTTFDFDDCYSLKNINGKALFNSETGDFEYNAKDLIFDRYKGGKNIGFMNDFARFNAKKIVSEIVTPDMSDVRKVRAIHDYVCEKFTFDYNEELPDIDGTYYTLFASDTAVCRGYSSAFGLLAQEAGIEVGFVYGVNHVWNTVKLNGMNFNVDCTWDDTLDSGKVSHDYFLKSYDQIADDVHTQLRLANSDELFYKTTDLFDVIYEEMPSCTDVIGDTNRDGTLNIADAVILNKYLLNSAVGDVPNFPVDVNSDGSVDVFDLVAMRKNSDSFGVSDFKAMGKYLLNSATGDVPNFPVDVNSDGSVDVFDLVEMRKNSDGFNSSDFRAMEKYLLGSLSDNTTEILGDTNLDGYADVFDLVNMRQNFPE